MDLALHDRDHGYYARGAEVLGAGGDYFTASDVGRAFGASIARQLIELDRSIGAPSTFVVVEYGAGRGLLARDIIDATLDTVLSKMKAQDNQKMVRNLIQQFIELNKDEFKPTK